MNKGKIRITISFAGIFCLLYIAHNLLPIVGQYMSAIAYAGIFVITALSIYPTWFKRLKIQSDVIKLLPILAIPLLNLLRLYLFKANYSGIPLFLYSTLQIFIYGLISAYYIKHRNIIASKQLLILLFIMLGITAFTTGTGCINHPNAARYMARVETTSDPLYIYYTQMNIGGFELTYILLLTVPLAIYLIKTNKIATLLGLIYVALVGFEIIYSEYTTAFLLYLVSLSLLFFNKLSSKNSIVLGIVIIFLLTIGRDLLVDLLRYVANITNSQIMSSRIEYVISTLSGVEYDNIVESGDRLSLYLSSIETFFSSWLLGVWSNSGIGGHSYILDNLAIYGITGLIAIYCQYNCIYKLYIKNNRQKDYYYYLLFIFFEGIVLAILNTQQFLFIYILVIPLFTYVIDSDNEKSLDSK